MAPVCVISIIEPSAAVTVKLPAESTAEIIPFSPLSLPLAGLVGCGEQFGAVRLKVGVIVKTADGSLTQLDEAQLADEETSRFSERPMLVPLNVTEDGILTVTIESGV